MQSVANKILLFQYLSTTLTTHSHSFYIDFITSNAAGRFETHLRTKQVLHSYTDSKIQSTNYPQKTISNSRKANPSSGLADYCLGSYLTNGHQLHLSLRWLDTTDQSLISQSTKFIQLDFINTHRSLVCQPRKCW